MVYLDRRDAGRQLAALLTHHRTEQTIVLALPRGGMPVGDEVAIALGAPLDVFLVRKLGLPGREELAMGAIASGGVRVDNADVLKEFSVSMRLVAQVAEVEETELHRQEALFRAERPPLDVRGKTAILVDDGLATGATMRAAVIALRQLEPRRIVVGVPVGAPSTCRELAELADEVVCVLQPNDFRSVGSFYRRFEQTTDAEVKSILAEAALKP